MEQGNQERTGEPMRKLAVLLAVAGLGSTRQRNAWFSVLAGVLKPRVLRGRVLSFLAT